MDIKNIVVWKFNSTDKDSYRQALERPTYRLLESILDVILKIKRISPFYNGKSIHPIGIQLLYYGNQYVFDLLLANGTDSHFESKFSNIPQALRRVSPLEFGRH